MVSLKNEFLFQASPWDFREKIPLREMKARKYLGLSAMPGARECEHKPDGSMSYCGYGTLKKDSEVILDKSRLGLNWITLNSYGSLILCSSAILIADVDIEGLDYRHVKSVLDPWYTRVYRTHSGHRIMSTAPSDYVGGIGDVLILLERLNSDPKYIKFMDFQRYGRARVSPKPWRWDGVSPCQVARLVYAFGSRSTVSQEQHDAFMVHDLLTNSYSPESYPLV